MKETTEIDFVRLNYGKDTIRFWSITYVILYFLFGIVDYYAAPTSHFIFWMIRLSALPFFVVVILSTYFDFLIKLRQLFNSVMVFIVPFSIIIMIAISKTGELSMQLYFAGIVLSSFPIGFITMSVRYTLIIVLMMLASYFLILGVGLAMESKTFIISSSFVVTATLATILSAYLLESNQRKIIKQAVELDSLLKLKDKLISILAHDLRSPCGNIIGFSDLILADPQSFKEADIVTIMQGVKKSATKLFDLLQNLLEWSKIQSTSNEIQPSIIQIKDLIKDNLEVLSGMISLKDIEIKYDESNCDTLVYIDQKMIGSVLRNLLSNAIKFTPEGGWIEIFCKKGKNQLFISVVDSGVGIPRDKLPKIFEVIKGKSTFGTNKEAGSGLGLILCKELITKNNGDIWAESIKGRGSKFSFSLPLYSALHTNGQLKNKT